MAADEELQLRVRLIDEATPQLEKLKSSFAEIGSGGSGSLAQSLCPDDRSADGLRLICKCILSVSIRRYSSDGGSTRRHAATQEQPLSGCDRGCFWLFFPDHAPRCCAALFPSHDISELSDGLAHIFNLIPCRLPVADGEPIDADRLAAACSGWRKFSSIEIGPNYAQTRANGMETPPKPAPPPAKPLALSDSELDAVMAAARPLESHQRDGFLRDIATELSKLPAIGDGAVYRTIVEVQRRYFDAPDFRPGSAGKYARPISKRG
jgi:hypothetical protein